MKRQKKRSANRTGGERAALQSTQLPLYVTLSRLLQSEIAAGHWPTGSQLPTIAELAEKYGVARVTIRQALGVLSTTGQINAIQGKGTFVAEPLQGAKPIELVSNWQHFLRGMEGNTPEALSVLAKVELPLLSKDQGKPFGTYRYMQRVHRRGDQPYCLTEIYLCNAFYRKAPKRFDNEMITSVLSQLQGVRLKRMTQSFRIGTASLEAAKVLNIPPGAPIGDVTRVITNRDNQILYLAYAHYRGDLVVFNTSLDVPTKISD